MLRRRAAVAVLLLRNDPGRTCKKRCWLPGLCLSWSAFLPAVSGPRECGKLGLLVARVLLRNSSGFAACQMPYPIELFPMIRYDSCKIVTSQKGDTGFASDGADPAMREASRFALRTVKHEKGEPMGFPRELKRTAAGAAGCSCPFNPQGKKRLGGGALPENNRRHKRR